MQKENDLRDVSLSARPTQSLHIVSTKLQYLTIKKPLPHISEHYEYKFNNLLLLSKICQPKRDKVIMSSLGSIGGDHYPYRSVRSQQDVRHRSANRLHSLSKAQSIKAQNQRMCKRIVKTNSAVEESLRNTYFTYVRSRKMKRRPRELASSNTGPVLSLQTHAHSTSADNKPTPSSNNSPRLRTGNAKRSAALISNIIKASLPKAIKVIGNGPTVLAIDSVTIDVKPNLALDTMLALQIILKPEGSSPIEPDMTLRSQPFSYAASIGLDSKRGKPLVKFGINVSKIGDFLPLRIWAYKGLKGKILGRTELNLTVFRNLQFLQPELNSDVVQTITKTVSGQMLKRNLVHHRAVGKLHNEHGSNTALEATVDYHIYSKRYGPVLHRQSQDPMDEAFGSSDGSAAQ